MAKELADQGRTLIAIMERAHTDQIVSNKIRSDKPSTGGLVSQLSELSLSYGNVIALDNVSLQIPANRIVGFIVPDGVGKSSLLGLISGVRKM